VSNFEDGTRAAEAAYDIWLRGIGDDQPAGVFTIIEYADGTIGIDLADRGSAGSLVITRNELLGLYHWLGECLMAGAGPDLPFSGSEITEGLAVLIEEPPVLPIGEGSTEGIGE